MIERADMSHIPSAAIMFLRVEPRAPLLINTGGILPSVEVPCVKDAGDEILRSSPGPAVPELGMDGKERVMFHSPHLLVIR